jgi:hypothetical protein
MNYNDPAGLGVPFSPFLPTYPPDSYISGKRVKEEKFTAATAIGSFVKGMASPFVEMLKHPVKTLAAAAAIGIALRKVPVLGKYLAMAGMAIGGLQFLTGMGKAATGVMDGDKKAAEDGFKSMGTGTVSGLLSAFGYKKFKAPAKIVEGEVSATGTTTAENTANSVLGTTKGETAATTNPSIFTPKTEIPASTTGTTQATETAEAVASTSSKTSAKTSEGLVDKVKTFFKGKNKNSDDFDKLLKDGKEVVGSGFQYQVPIATYYGIPLASKTTEGAETSEEPLALRMVDDITAKNL